LNEVPDPVVDVVIGVVSEAGLAGKVAAQAAFGVFNGAAPPRAVGITEKGALADLRGDRLVPGEPAAVVVGDGAPSSWRQAAQFRNDGAGGEFGILAEKTTGQGRAHRAQCPSSHQSGRPGAGQRK